MDFYVLPELTSALPNQNINIAAWEFPNNIILADPHFNEPGEVELIIGAEHYFDLLRDGRSRIAEDGPVLQNTVFGWVVSGRVPSRSTSAHVAVAQLNSAPTNRSDFVPWRPACRSGHPHELDACSTFGCTSKRCNRIRGTAENKLSISSSVHNCA